MAKVVFRSLKGVKPRKKDTAVTVKRVRNPEGGKTTVYVVDADSQTFGADLTYAFQRNVTRARRLNKRLAERSGQTAADR